MSDQWNKLEHVLTQSWRILARGSADVKHPFHWPAFVTAGEPGIQARIVILREVSEQKRQLICHADVRTVKIQGLKSHPKACWLFYDPRLRLQLRIKGPTSVCTEGPKVEKAWAGLPIANRRNYSASISPGQEINHFRTGQQAYQWQEQLALPETEAWRKNFAMISTEADEIDWLLLTGEGHRRAVFQWNKDIWKMKWVVP